MTICQTASKTKAALAAAAVLGLPVPAWAGPADTYYERAFVVAADARCNLFAPQIDAALNAATAQARGAALRSGAGEADLAAAAARARSRAGTVSCADPQLATVRARIDGAFEGWLRTPRMVFPGARRAWTANRVSSSAANWRLQQMSMVGASPVAFGYAGEGDAPGLTAVVSFVGRSRPYAARIVLRDPIRVPRPWLAGDGLVPVSAQASLWATGVSPADQTLLSEGRRAGEAWRFPAATTAALQRLDPRETFAIEFHFRDGSVATAKFEAGDFTAGRAFLAMGML
ncbi:hypothetical protein [Brevundimonas sp.]|uniref:hypothetical protein n=1 Tax=Brevundimonas sp. TaxID=1871086 RepID=UPI0027307AB7|nr:hypothetical protein [Brevundimonas sp.]MDP1914170.1 hypothetical protein [Brevundimonas sp.]